MYPNYEYPHPNQEFLEAFEETKNLIESEHPGYGSLDDMFESIDQAYLQRT